MTITHHPDDATLLSFASGTLGEALGAVIAAHVDWCVSCQAEVARMGRIGGVLLEQVEPGAAELGPPPHPVPPAPRARATRPAPLPFAARTGTPMPLARLLNKPLEEAHWKRFGIGVALCSLPLSPGAKGALYLMRIEPGRSVPAHGHGGAELTLVLQGSYRDEIGRFAAGDISDLDDQHDHKPVVDSAEPCICLIGSDGGLRFKGLIGRLLQPFFR